MSTTVTFAGVLAEDPELLHTKDDEPYLRCRVIVKRRVREGEPINEETSTRHVTIFGSAATHVRECVSAGDPIFVHGLESTETWDDREHQEEKHSRYVVVVDNHFGEVGLSLR